MFDKGYNMYMLTGFLLLLVISIYYTFQLKFDYNFEAFFPHDNTDLDFYDQFRDKFEPDDNYILVALKNVDNSVFDREFLQKIEDLTKRSAELPYVEQVSSLANMQKPVFFMGKPMKIPVLNTAQPEKYTSDSAKIMNDPRLVGRFIAENAQSLAVVIKTDHVLKLSESQEFGRDLEKLLEQYDFHEYHIAGRAHYQALFVEKSKEEFFTFFFASAGLILIILIIILRKVWGVAIAMASVLIAMIMFMGFLGAFQITLDPMSTLFPILMIIVGMSDIIHFLSKYVDELNKGITRKEAVRKTVREIGFATFLTSATTAIGFASLFTSKIPPIKHFGITAAIGVFIAYISVLLFTTAIISLFSAEHIIRKKKRKSTWDRIMHWNYLFTRKHPKAIAGVALAVIIICIIGISQVTTNVHVENNFPRNDKVRSDFRFFEQEFGGVRSLEIGILPKEGSKVEDVEVLKYIDSLENYISRLPAITSVFSPTTIYKSLNRAYHADDPKKFTLPEDEERIFAFNDLLIDAPESAVNVVTSADKKYGRLTAKFIDQGSNSNKELRAEITDWINNNIDTAVVGFRHTGTSFLFDKNNEYLRGSLFSGLGLAFLLISILMALLFRNWKMVIISLIPNVIPLVIAGAIIGYMGIELDAATSVIFAIAFGVAVDDTIHFLSKFKLELNKGRSITEAVKYTFAESGKALCLTTVILFFGFSILMASSYPPTFNIGFLISLTLISALISDLFLIPVLIYWLLGTHERMEIKEMQVKKIFTRRKKETIASLN